MVVHVMIPYTPQIKQFNCFLELSLLSIQPCEKDVQNIGVLDSKLTEAKNFKKQL